MLDFFNPGCFAIFGEEGWFMLSNLLLVCVGNLCRSPMAEGFFAEKTAKLGNFSVNSAGLRAVVGESAVSKAQEVMCGIGVDITKHRAKQLTCDMIKEANLILVMEKWHKKEIESMMPTARGKVYLLGQWGNFEVPDPYTKPTEAFEQCLQLIEKAWQDWYSRIIQ